MPIADLDDDQKTAATLGGNEVVVSAGAGSGKTRLLVGRYLYLAATLGTPPREIAAITFTNKAADQMKARIAAKAPELAARYPELTALWREIAERIHDAPISTIHAFCNSILRAHPAEAGIDPLFEVLDETTLASLRTDTLDRFLFARMEEEPAKMEALAGVFGLGGLRTILDHLLSERPRMAAHLDTGGIPDSRAIGDRYRGSTSRELGSVGDGAPVPHTPAGWRQSLGCGGRTRGCASRDTGRGRGRPHGPAVAAHGCGYDPARNRQEGLTEGMARTGAGYRTSARRHEGMHRIHRGCRLLPQHEREVVLPVVVCFWRNTPSRTVLPRRRRSAPHRQRHSLVETWRPSGGTPPYGVGYRRDSAICSWTSFRTPMPSSSTSSA